MVLDGLLGLYEFKYDSATVYMLLLYLCSYKLIGYASQSSKYERNRGKLASTGAVVGTTWHACQIWLGNAIILGWDEPSRCRRRRASSRHPRPTARRRRRRLTGPVFASPVIMYCFFSSPLFFFAMMRHEHRLKDWIVE